MQRALQGVFFILPLLFGIGFIAPALAQAMVATGVAPPLGLSPVAFGLAIGAPWGLYATVKGSWL
jgi:hypothetical protein